ncbi:hypothetical protein BDK51DRAFT_40282 [Blyttiomyces helicus]|uniref:Uncharacterized protein n=1 Tax=Blyttiomyces helicus TaxID=388810 RepID=A0A4P9WDD5_9FUNG|nr:hypothetical protein BDK51DRAFT_40282 [Blyttiomyces helicus]|eukprot:RKO89238.1 hypothetical protein BDK51DRAFT_40282 [Blyttiomyces helicus]
MAAHSPASPPSPLASNSSTLFNHAETLNRLEDCCRSLVNKGHWVDLEAVIQGALVLKSELMTMRTAAGLCVLGLFELPLILSSVELDPNQHYIIPKVIQEATEKADQQSTTSCLARIIRINRLLLSSILAYTAVIPAGTIRSLESHIIARFPTNLASVAALGLGELHTHPYVRTAFAISEEDQLPFAPVTDADIHVQLANHASLEAFRLHVSQAYSAPAIICSTSFDAVVKLVKLSCTSASALYSIDRLSYVRTIVAGSRSKAETFTEIGRALAGSTAALDYKVLRRFNSAFAEFARSWESEYGDKGILLGGKIRLASRSSPATCRPSDGMFVSGHKIGDSSGDISKCVTNMDLEKDMGDTRLSLLFTLYHLAARMILLSVHTNFRLPPELNGSGSGGGKIDEPANTEAIVGTLSPSPEIQLSKMFESLKRVTEAGALSDAFASGSPREIVAALAQAEHLVESELALNSTSFSALGHGPFLGLLVNHCLISESASRSRALPEPAYRAHEWATVASFVHQCLTSVGCSAVDALATGGLTARQRISACLCTRSQVSAVRDLGFGPVEAVIERADTSEDTGLITPTQAWAAIAATPFLIPITEWTQWDAVFAPELGPLPAFMRTARTPREFALFDDGRGRLVRVPATAKRRMSPAHSKARSRARPPLASSLSLSVLVPSETAMLELVAETLYHVPVPLRTPLGTKCLLEALRRICPGLKHVKGPIAALPLELRPAL